MKIIYIKETEETCDIVKRIIIIIKRIFNFIKIENINERIIYYLPVFKNSKISRRRIKKIANRIIRLLEVDASNNIVLSEYLNNNQLLKNHLYNENINILDGRGLFKCLTFKTLEYICNIKDKKIELRRSIYLS